MCKRFWQWLILVLASLVYKEFAYPKSIVISVVIGAVVDVVVDVVVDAVID